MMRCLAHHIALAFRSTIELVKASWEFNRILAFSVAAESMSAQEPGSLCPDGVDGDTAKSARAQSRATTAPSRGKGSHQFAGGGKWIRTLGPLS